LLDFCRFSRLSGPLDCDFRIFLDLIKQEQRGVFYLAPERYPVTVCSNTLLSLGIMFCPPQRTRQTREDPRRVGLGSFFSDFSIFSGPVSDPSKTPLGPVKTRLSV
jgi:hypothetical protein